MEEQSCGLIQILATTSPLLRKDIVMIDVQIVKEDFGILPLIINPTGRVCLMSKEGVARGVSMKTHLFCVSEH